MPKKYIPEGKQIGDEVEAFVYMDSEDRPVATTEKPLVQVGQFGALKVLEVNELGAFADWGVLKDLLIPYAEQRENLEEGQSVVVYVYLDKVSRRIVGSAKVEKFLDTYALDVEEGDEVDFVAFDDAWTTHVILSTSGEPTAYVTLSGTGRLVELPWGFHQLAPLYGPRS